MALNIKEEFGRRLRLARDAKRMSRATLAFRLGISPKTIQSWEMGRTFIEKLELIPALENELDINISHIIAQSVNPGVAPLPAAARTGDESDDALGAAESAVVYGGPRKPRPKVGPLDPQFDIRVPPVGQVETPEAGALDEQWVAVPMLSPQGVLKPIVTLTTRDVQEHVLAPLSWMPRGGVMVATRMGDSGMAPMIPLGATVFIDRRPQELEKDVGRILAMSFHGKGLRIRRLVRDMANGKYYGSSSVEHARNRLPIREDKGDQLIGRVIGWMNETPM